MEYWSRAGPASAFATRARQAQPVAVGVPRMHSALNARSLRPDTEGAS